MDTNFYDVVVCGGDLPGLIAAALISKRGTRVLLCGHDQVPSTFMAAGYQLSRGPGLLPSTDYEPVARVLKELNQAQIARRRAPALVPAFQLVLPDRRLDVGPGTELTLREVTREFPDDADTIRGVLERAAGVHAALDPILASDLTLPPDGFWERREVARVEPHLPEPGTDPWAPLPQQHPMRVALATCATLLSHLGPGETGAVADAAAVGMARRGLHRMDGGLAEVAGLFLDRIRAGTGDVREKVTPAELVIKRGKVVGLKVKPRGEPIGLDRLIWADSAAALVTLAGDKSSRRLREIASAIRPACYRYTLCLLLRREALPEGMAGLVFSVADPELPALEDNAIMLTTGGARPKDDSVAMWVECLVPAATVAAGLGYLAVLRGRLREHIARVVPFFDDHLVVLASPHDGLAPEIGRAGTEPRKRDHIAPTPMTPALSCDLPRTLGVGAAPHDVGMKNVFLTSDENLPGLGGEGAFISAWGAVRLLLGPLPRRVSSRKEILIEDG